MKIVIVTIFMALCLFPAYGNHNLEEQAKAIFKSWFVDFSALEEQEFFDNNGAIVPAGWEVSCLTNIADYLISMGAKITGAGSDIITICGVDKLHQGSIRVLPDRIEAGTYILAGVMNGKNLEICDVEPKHLTSFFEVLKKMGCDFKIYDDKVVTNKVNHLKPVNIVTAVYPGFATDLQQPITTLLLMADGVSTVKETIYENRFQNTKYLNEMGANIEVLGDTIKVYGPTFLKGKLVRTSDLRAGAALVLAALSAEGETTITDIKHLLRGYSDLIKKLTNVGAKIWLEDE